MNLIFERECLKSFFTGDQEKRITRIEGSLKRANEYYLSAKSTTVNIRKTLQFEKDETIITLLTMAAIQRCQNKGWEEFIRICFPKEDIEINNPNVVLERAISASFEIQDNLRPLAEAHPVKYIRKQALTRRSVEGRTNFDAVLSLNDHIKVFLECKFT